MNFALTEDEAKTKTIGDLFVWNVVNFPNRAHFYPISSPRAAYDLINTMADIQLTQPWVESNAFGLVRLDENGELEEWEDDNGYDVCDHFDKAQSASA